MAKRLMVVCVCLLAMGSSARAQDPYNLSVPVKNLATLFTGLYGPNGLVVDSLATLPGEQPHTAHFNSDFQTNFSQFSKGARPGQQVGLQRGEAGRQFR